jgi:hypothetical protein
MPRAPPPNGFGVTLDSMFAFHRERGLEPHRGHDGRRAEQDFARWCFDNRDYAEAFQKGFGANLT